MELTGPQREALTRHVREVVSALNDIAAAARTRLDQTSAVAPRDVVALPINPMTTSRAPILHQIGRALNEDRQTLSRLAREPFVARVVVAEDSSKEEAVFYISRGSVAGIDVEGARLVNYGAPLGRLAELPPGDEFHWRAPSGVEQVFTVCERARLRPRQSDGAWDATDTTFETEDWQVVLASLQRFLQQEGFLVDDDAGIPDLLGELLLQHRESELLRAKARRALIESISLRDQPILDAFQGEIFRLPLNKKILLLGPPGTGKTTTLIRRLAHKRTADTLSEEERELLERRGLSQTFFGPHGWAMFAPTELLKLYLQEAFSREGIPATDEHLRTWTQERLDLGRNVLRILRSVEHNGFQLDTTGTPLAAGNSPCSASLFDCFSKYANESVATLVADAISSLHSSGNTALWNRVETLMSANSDPSLPRALARILDRADFVLPDLKRLDEEIDTETRRIGNTLVNWHKSLIDELVQSLSGWAQDGTNENGDDRDDEPDDAEALQSTSASAARPTPAIAAQVLMDALRVFARNAARGRASNRGRVGLVLTLLGERAPSRDQVSKLGALLLIRQRLRAVVNAPRTFVMSVPQLYNRFRRASAENAELYQPSVSHWVRTNRISGPELDVLILTMLRNARLLMQPDALRGNITMSSNPSWLEDIRGRYIPQVFVDEATDFSAVQLGCMAELAHPSLRSWFACGDFMQRITRDGIGSSSEVEWLATLDGEPVDVRSVSVGYRQSDKLRALAMSVTDSVSQKGAVRLDAPEHEHPDGVAPLLAENTSGTDLGAWLAGRIVEIETRLGILPSIAIFVDGDERIEPLAQTLKPLLATHNLSIVGCPGGRVVGDDREVRVFDVRFIKGLEFEAVFFVAVDRLEESLGPLFGHLFYVGASRAATYLGVTAEGHLPGVLMPLRDHFSAGDWSA